MARAATTTDVFNAVAESSRRDILMLLMCGESAVGDLVVRGVRGVRPDGEAVNTMILFERDGATTLAVTVLHSSKENRDGHVESGMEGGLQISLNRIENLPGGRRRADEADRLHGPPAVARQVAGEGLSGR